MAYAWTAEYGYFVGSTSQGAYVDLNNKYTTDSGFHFEGVPTLYTLPESLTAPSPISSGRVNLKTAKGRIITLTEYNYTTLIPFCSPDNNEVITSAEYNNWRVTLEKLFPGAFFYSRGIVDAAYSLRNTQHNLFVYLTDINVIIDHQGAIYSVDPVTHKITKRANAGNYFRTFSLCGGVNTSATQKNVDGYAYISYLYNGTWYSVDVFVRYVENYTQGETIKEEQYSIWNSSPRAANVQTAINNYLIGTPENPKYKYKTDPADPDTDPYTPPLTPLTPSGPGGGEGTHDPNPGNDPAPIPDITEMTSILDTDFMTAYKMTAGALKNLGAFLWSQSFYGAIANVMNSPFDVIIGLHIVPVNPSIESNARSILLGNVDSAIAGYRVTSQYVEKDLGGFDVPHIWGAYLDYQGKFEIFLPFIGFRSIAADDIVGHQIRVKYHIDVVTGACIAYVLTDDYVTYTFAGSCSYNIPVTGQNYSNIISSMIQTAGTIGMAAIAPEGMGAAGAMAAAGSALNTAMSKPTYSRSGGMGGNSAFMGMRTPVLIARVPNIAIPGNQNKIVGYPSIITRTLSEVHGYTEVYKVHLEGIGASDTEKSEIETALMEGVIL